MFRISNIFVYLTGVAIVLCSGALFISSEYVEQRKRARLKLSDHTNSPGVPPGA